MYQLDYANRRAAQAAEQGLMQAQHQAAARANQASREFRQSYGDPRASQSNHDNMLATVTSPYAAAMGQHEMQMRHAMQNAMNNEMVQVQNRIAALPEAQIASKNNSDRLRYELERQKNLQNYQLGMAQNRSLDNLANMDYSINAGDTEMPETNLYDNDGERIGGSKNSLFAQSGIKKSLLS